MGDEDPSLSFGPRAEELAALATLFKQRRFPEMETAARELTLRFPDHGRGWKALGTAIIQQGRNAEALAVLQQAAALLPGDSATHNNLGSALKEAGRYAEAEASLQTALAIDPDFVEARINLGYTFRKQGRLLDADGSFRGALAIDPDAAEALTGLGANLTDQGRYAEAEDSLRRALVLKPAAAETCDTLGNTLRLQGRLDAAEDAFRKALAINPDHATVRSNLLLTLNYTTRHSPAQCLDEARAYGQMLAERNVARFSTWSCPAEPRPLRVGLVSGDFGRHPVGYFLEGLLAHVDPARVELIAYPTSHRSDELTERIRPRFAAWTPLVGCGDDEAARIVHAGGVHVLIDLSGHTAHNRLPMFARKPAPVQVSWLGYFATTGVAEIDYLLADDIGVPASARDQFTETLWYLPDTRICFTPPASAPAVAALPALANGYTTFGCFQNLAKISDAAMALWGRVFAALPTARLRLQCPQLGESALREEVVARLARQGIDVARVATHGGGPHDAYLTAHAEVDLILDTFPFAGGTTTCEALWMGVPTLTLAGDRMVARQGASLLTAAGLPAWVAADEDEYVRKAVRLATDWPMLSNLRADLRQQVLASPLFDARRFARNFEAALAAMWRQHRTQTTP